MFIYKIKVFRLDLTNCQSQYCYSCEVKLVQNTNNNTNQYKKIIASSLQGINKYIQEQTKWRNIHVTTTAATVISGKYKLNKSRLM